MRPVEKCEWPTENEARKRYDPHTIAKPDLEDNLGCYCCYCEAISSCLQVEHVICRDQDASKHCDWDNFLLACATCNGKSNKSNKQIHPDNLEGIHFPHRNNTMLSFSYFSNGAVTVNTALEHAQQTAATRMLELVGLDKIPGHPLYKVNDKRWVFRKDTWAYAELQLGKLELNEIRPQDIAEAAVMIGYFSIWFTVFQNHPSVRQALIQAFKGTALNCFDPENGYAPIPRNPNHPADNT